MDVMTVIGQKAQWIGREVTIDGFLVAERGEQGRWYLAPSHELTGELSISIQIDRSHANLSFQERVTAQKEKRWEWLDLSFQLQTEDFPFFKQSRRNNSESIPKLPSLDEYHHYTYATLTGTLEDAIQPDFAAMLTHLTRAVVHNDHLATHVKLGGITTSDIAYRSEHDVYTIEQLFAQQQLPFGQLIAIDGFLVSDPGDPTTQRMISHNDFMLMMEEGKVVRNILFDRQFAASFFASRIWPCETSRSPILIHFSLRIVGVLKPTDEENSVAILDSVTELAFEHGRTVHWATFP